MTKQRTITVDGKKITIKSKPATYVGNQRGWYVFINDNKYFSNKLVRIEAEESVLEKFLKNVSLF